MSILHRMTGAANGVGLLIFSWWLLAAASGPAAYETFIHFITSPLGYFLLFGWSVSVFYHLCNGIRHLIWDAGYLFKIENAYRAGYVVLTVTAILTALVWLT
jgi:succinate dehydrogenase / fumarate reductase cytochrome b subunit